VVCWPSDGGIWIKAATALELEWLGLSRFKSVARPPQYNDTEEDLLCARLRGLGGAKFWRVPPGNDPPYKWDCLDIEDCWNPELHDRWVAGVEKGGAWILDLVDGKYPDHIMGLMNAFTMEERCRSIELLGGTFFPDSKSAP
jgi:hypothetical protein